eukprot:GEZU01029474.1.p1 GENE.GEZU01029474.1~~GEZU01029474.1.p1  ORF type:complete len:177 (+),score=34.02 GEZU01029474.1:54-533(+)
MVSRKLKRIVSNIAGFPKRKALGVGNAIKNAMINFSEKNTTPELKETMKNCCQGPNAISCKCADAREAYRRTVVACIPYRFEGLKNEWVYFKDQVSNPGQIQMGVLRKGLLVLAQCALLFWGAMSLGRGSFNGFRDEPHEYQETEGSNTSDQQEPSSHH